MTKTYMKGVRCKKCGKEFALALEGTIWLYCRACRQYQAITASTGETAIVEDGIFLHVPNGIPGIEIREVKNGGLDKLRK